MPENGGWLRYLCGAKCRDRGVSVVAISFVIIASSISCLPLKIKKPASEWDAGLKQSSFVLVVSAARLPSRRLVASDPIALRPYLTIGLPLSQIFNASGEVVANVAH